MGRAACELDGLRVSGEAIMNVKAMMIAAAMVAASGPSQAAGRTIVGTWAPDPAACTPVGGMISIGPMALTGDELACTFDDVDRSGDVVTWHGRCGEPEPAQPATVVAKLQGEVLRMSIAGADRGAYRRCLTVPNPPEAKITGPWPGDHWQADVDAVREGHALHAKLTGATTTTGRGDSVEVTCTGRDLAIGKIIVRSNHAWALSRQDDYEGDAGPLGSFGTSDGSTLRWFSASPCPAGPITWHRR